MKIKLIHYPYGDYPIGEVVDLGQEKNASMVALNRAVWIDNSPIATVAQIITGVETAPKKKILKASEPEQEPASEPEVAAEAPVEVQELPVEQVPAATTKKLLENDLKAKVNQKRQKDSKSFWDLLK